MRIIYIVRSPGTGQSIEALFANVQSEFTRQTDKPSRVVHLPCVSRNLSSVWKNVSFLRTLTKHRQEIFHITGDVHYAVLALPPAQTVLTIHDCSTLVNNRKRPLRYLIFWLFWYYLPVRRAGAVTVVSQKTRQELIRFVGQVAEKAVVIPNGYPAEVDLADLPQRREKPVLLQIGTAPNKNLLQLLKAINAIPCKLLIVGPLNAEQRHALKRHFIDYEQVVDADSTLIRELYARCDAVMFLSTYEGFGMPVLEANASGRPVIAADIEPIRYVAGNAAYLVDPTDSSAIRRAILRVLNDDAYRQQLILNGLENARRFPISQTVAQYRTVYQTLSILHRSAEPATT